MLVIKNQILKTFFKCRSLDVLQLVIINIFTILETDNPYFFWKQFFSISYCFEFLLIGSCNPKFTVFRIRFKES